jgi:hypothetical protein
LLVGDSMVNNVDDMTILHKKMESLGPVHQRNRFWPANDSRSHLELKVV